MFYPYTNDEDLCSCVSADMSLTLSPESQLSQ